MYCAPMQVIIPCGLLTFLPGSPDAFVNELMKPSGANLTLDSMDLN